MFTVYALNLNDPAHDTETEIRPPTLDEALTHLRELVLNEMAEPEGPTFDRYGIALEHIPAEQN